MIQYIQSNAHYITLVVIIVGCIIGWWLFDPNDWSGKH